MGDDEDANNGGYYNSPAVMITMLLVEEMMMVLVMMMFMMLQEMISVLQKITMTILNVNALGDDMSALVYDDDYDANAVGDARGARC